MKEATLRKNTRKALEHHLGEAAKGNGEMLFKEVYEDCMDDAALQIVDDEVKRCLQAIKALR